MLAYHMSGYDRLDAILTHGLRPNVQSRYTHVGNGIYVFFDKREVGVFADFLGHGITGPAVCLVVTVDVDPNNLLMDEDALYVWGSGPKAFENVRKVMPPEAVEQYMAFLSNRDYDELPIDNDEVAVFKVGLIDKYKIRPSKLFKVSHMHAKLDTARHVGPLQPKLIEIWFENELYQLDQRHIVDAALAMDA